MDGFLRPRHLFKPSPRDNCTGGYPEEDSDFELCLECPYIDCYHDKKHEARQQRIQARAGEMYHSYKHEKQAVREIAAAYRVSERTVKQALEMMNHPHKESPNEREEE
jgi:hypothetical protein